MADHHTYRSRGSVMLSSRGNRKVIAHALGLAISTINGLCAGSQKASQRTRELCEQLYQIDSPAWDEPAMMPQAASMPEAADVDPGEDVGTMTRDLARRVAVQCRRVITQLETDTNADPAHVAKQLDSLAATLAKLGKWSGLELTPRQILDSPHLRVVMKELLAALDPHPDAMRAAGEAIKKLTAEGD